MFCCWIHDSALTVLINGSEMSTTASFQSRSWDLTPAAFHGGEYCLIMLSKYRLRITGFWNGHIAALAPPVWIGIQAVAPASVVRGSSWNGRRWGRRGLVLWRNASALLNEMLIFFESQTFTVSSHKVPLISRGIVYFRLWRRALCFCFLELYTFNGTHYRQTMANLIVGALRFV